MGPSARPALVVLFALVVLVGCTEPPMPAPDVGPLEPFTPQTIFTILSPGIDPRPIRFSRRDMQREQARITNRIRQQDSVAGESRPERTMPVITMDYTTTSTTMPADHVLIVERSDDVELGTDSEVDSDLRSRVEANMRAKIGSVFVREETPTGETIAQGHRFPVTVDPASVDEQEQRLRAERGGAIPFPPDPLGEGARWQARQTTTYAGITSTAAYGATLVHRDRNHLTVQWTMVMHATVDATVAPEAPPWRTFQLRTMNVTSEGTKIVDLEALAPDEDTVDTTSVVSYALQGQPVTSTRTTHSVKVRRVPRAILLALAGVGLALLMLAARLPRWLRGETSMPYGVSRGTGAMFAALGLAAFATSFAGRHGVRPFTTSVEVLVALTVPAVAGALFVLYWWRWRAGAGGPQGTPPYR